MKLIREFLFMALLILAVVEFAMLCSCENELRKTKISRNLWHQHAMATANWRVNNYQSDYSYLTKGGTKCGQVE